MLGQVEATLGGVRLDECNLALHALVGGPLAAPLPVPLEVGHSAIRCPRESSVVGELVRGFLTNVHTLNVAYPSASASTQNAGAAASLIKVPPAASAAWMRGSASSCGTDTSKWLRLRCGRGGPIPWD